MADTIGSHSVVLNAQVDGLVAGMRKGTGAISEFHREQGKAAASFQTGSKAASRFGVVVGQAGMQVQDLAVQIAGGQSKLLALAQQGSQLLSVFGPTGAIAGAVLAVGALGLRMLDTSQATKEVKDRTDELVESYKSLVSARRDAFFAKVSPIEQEGILTRELEANARAAAKAEADLAVGRERMARASQMGRGDRVTSFPTAEAQKGYENAIKRFGTAEAKAFGGVSMSGAEYGELAVKQIEEAQLKLNALTEDNLKKEKEIAAIRKKSADEAVESSFGFAKKQLDTFLQKGDVERVNRKIEGQKLQEMYKRAETITDKLRPIEKMKREAKGIGEIPDRFLSPEDKRAAIDAMIKPTALPQALQVNAGASALGGTVGEGGAVLEAQRQLAKSAREQTDILRRMLQLWSTGSN